MISVHSLSENGENGENFKFVFQLKTIEFKSEQFYYST